MEIVYRRRKATAAEVWSDLADPPSKTAVRSLLRILENKGELKHKPNGRAFIYIPIHARAQAARLALEHVLATFFDGSLQKAVAAYEVR